MFFLSNSKIRLLSFVNVNVIFVGSKFKWTFCSWLGLFVLSRTCISLNVSLSRDFQNVPRKLCYPEIPMIPWNTMPKKALLPEDTHDTIGIQWIHIHNIAPHSEKSFRNLIKSNLNLIVFTINNIYSNYYLLQLG